MATTSSKRKRCADIKEWVVDEIYKLSINSLNFNTELQTTHDDFVVMFNNMEEKISDLYARSLAFEDKYM